MYKLCKTEQSANRQRALERGLLEAMTTQHFVDISISDLCLRMGVPRKSFYRYFDDKESALFALLDHTLMDFQPYALSHSSAGNRSIHSEMELFFRFWVLHKPLLDALRRSNLTSLLISRSLLYTNNAVIPQHFLPETNNEIRAQLTTFVVCGLMSLVLQWNMDGYPQSVSQMADVGVRLVTQPLFPNLPLK
jgi:AcrR family transcriptional regulator